MIYGRLFLFVADLKHQPDHCFVTRVPEKGQDGFDSSPNIEMPYLY
jgi:hypothetical protein